MTARLPLYRAANQLPSEMTTGDTLAFSLLSGTPTTLAGYGITDALATIIPAGYIDGLKMVWNSATSISVTSGTCYIQASNAVISFPSTLTLSGLSLTASTWYHLYGYLNSGTPAIELVTTAPAAAYSGTARSKTGDTSRRYLGSILSDASGNVANFAHGSDGFVVWQLDTRNAPFRCLSSGVATVATTVSLSGAIPVTANTAKINVLDTDSTATAMLGNSSASAFPIHVIRPLTGAPVSFPVDASQAMQYALSAAPGGGGAAFIDVLGYGLSR